MTARLLCWRPQKEMDMSDQPQYIYQEWPAWRYGPKGEAEIFNSAEEVPKGWKDAPAPVAEEDF